MVPTATPPGLGVWVHSRITFTCAVCPATTERSPDPVQVTMSGLVAVGTALAVRVTLWGPGARPVTRKAAEGPVWGTWWTPDFSVTGGGPMVLMSQLITSTSTPGTRRASC